MIAAKDVSTDEQSETWRPELPGYSTDILPFYRWLSERIPKGGTFLEVGVAFGRSLAFMAELRPDVRITGVDPFVLKAEWCGQHAHVITKYGSHAEAFKLLAAAHAPELAQANIVTGTFRDLPASPLDAIFIDGQHTYEEVHGDIKQALSLVKPGGILAGHDYEPGYPGVMRAVNELLGTPERHGRTCWWVQR